MYGGGGRGSLEVKDGVRNVSVSPSMSCGAILISYNIRDIVSPNSNSNIRNRNPKPGRARTHQKPLTSPTPRQPLGSSSVHRLISSIIDYLLWRCVGLRQHGYGGPAVWRRWRQIRTEQAKADQKQGTPKLGGFGCGVWVMSRAVSWCSKVHPRAVNH
eukprot:1194917-Prorocentrum_minimum.AAC.9